MPRTLIVPFAKPFGSNVQPALPTSGEAKRDEGFAASSADMQLERVCGWPSIARIIWAISGGAPGMSIDRMPIMAWYLLVTAFMMLFGFPPLILGSILLELERAFDLPFFDPTRGGDPLLWQHLFWLFGHPEVYIIFLPAAGAISMMIPTFARHELVGYLWIVVAVIALGFLSFGLWVHHMFAVGIPHLALAFFSAASGLVAPGTEGTVGVVSVVISLVRSGCLGPAGRAGRARRARR